MTRVNRAFMAFVLVGLLTPSLSWAERASGEGAGRTYLISGMVGVPGVTLKGLPGDPTSDQRGLYSVQVEQGWSGTVTPAKEGYVFEPETRVYSSIFADLPNQDYAAKIMTFAISGNAHMAGVTMEGLPGHVVTHPDGRYGTKLPYGWTGTVVPKKSGFRFEPSQRAYERLTEDQTNQDYRAHPETVVISDVIQLSHEGPLEGVTVRPEPEGDADVTDSQGRYIVRVPYGWTGHLKLAKEGYEFPDTLSLRYVNVTHHLIDGERMPALEEPVIPPPRASAMLSRPVLPAAASDVLVIATDEVAPARFAEMTEDMGVMLHILREQLSEPRMILGVLYDYGDFFGGGGRDIRAIYLQGHGALFLMEMDFPLSFPSESRGEGGQKEKEPVDPVWQRARQRLYAPPGAMRYGTRGRPGGTDGVSFEQFREDLVKTLRHAANIRNIEPNEWVILTVVGRGEAGFGAGPSGRGMSGMMGGGGGGMMGGGGWVQGGGYSAGGGSTSGGTGSFGGRGGFYMDSRSYSGARRDRLGSRLGQSQAPSASTTVLTIQAKKADIDALARDDIDLEQFRQKVKVFTY